MCTPLGSGSKKPFNGGERVASGLRFTLSLFSHGLRYPHNEFSLREDRKHSSHTEMICSLARITKVYICLYHNRHQ